MQSARLIQELYQEAMAVVALMSQPDVLGLNIEVGSAKPVVRLHVRDGLAALAQLLDLPITIRRTEFFVHGGMTVGRVEILALFQSASIRPPPFDAARDVAA